MNGTTRKAGRLLEQLLAEVGPVEMGFRIQGLAAHVMLALGYRIIKIKSSGHPDVVAEKEQGIVRVEVEANTRGIGLHLPEPTDLIALDSKEPGDEGYFAVAICTPFPKWIVVDSYRLTNRKTKLALPWLEAISNKGHSQDWSQAFIRILEQHSDHLVDFSFEWLAKQALEQRCLV